MSYNLHGDKCYAEQLFDDKDAPSVWNVDETEFDDTEIDKFTDTMSVAWGGEEESQLRMAVFAAFVNKDNTANIRKKTVNHRKESIRRASESNTINRKGSDVTGRSARKMSEIKKNRQGSQNIHKGALSPQSISNVGGQQFGALGTSQKFEKGGSGYS